MTTLLLLAPEDNILVALGAVSKGANPVSDGSAVDVQEPVVLGHKIARVAIPRGETVIKYGVPIGSAVSDIEAGQHVHIHNMKSDYTPTHSLEETAQGHRKTESGSEGRRS